MPTPCWIFLILQNLIFKCLHYPTPKSVGGNFGNAYFKTMRKTQAMHLMRQWIHMSAVLILLLSLGSYAIASNEDLQASLVSVDITPPVGVPLAGYGARRMKAPQLF